MVDSGRNIYEIKFEVKFSGGMSFRRFIISDRRVVVEEMDEDEADNRDAARRGTQTDRNCTDIILLASKLMVKTTFLKLVWSVDSVSDIVS